MYGSGNTARMTEDVTTSLKQVIDGIGDSLGINPAVLISSFAGTKLAGLGVNAEHAKTVKASEDKKDVCLEPIEEYSETAVSEEE